MIEEFDINKLIEEEYQEFAEEQEGTRRESSPEYKVKKRGEGKSQTFTVGGNTTLLPFLFECFASQSRTTVKSYLRNRQVVVNGMPCTLNSMELVAGDSVVVSFGMTEEQFRHPMLRIVYEDDYVIVIDKKYGLLSMATDSERTRTAYYILSEYLKNKDRSNRVFIVHRLDRETSGLLLFAKSVEVQHTLQKNWNDNILERKYVAVVEGAPKESEGVVRTLLAENSRYLVYVTKDKEKGEMAVTQYKTIKKGKDNTLVELELETGKKNQIRVHMQHMGCPIIGDRKYGGHQSPIGRLALHASRMRFKHPVTGEEMVFDIGTPPMFLTALTLKRR